MTNRLDGSRINREGGIRNWALGKKSYQVNVECEDKIVEMMDHPDTHTLKSVADLLYDTGDQKQVAVNLMKGATLGATLRFGLGEQREITLQNIEIPNSNGDRNIAHIWVGLAQELSERTFYQLEDVSNFSSIPIHPGESIAMTIYGKGDREVVQLLDFSLGEENVPREPLVSGGIDVSSRALQERKPNLFERSTGNREDVGETPYREIKLHAEGHEFRLRPASSQKGEIGLKFEEHRGHATTAELYVLDKNTGRFRATDIFHSEDVAVLRVDVPNGGTTGHDFEVVIINGIVVASHHASSTSGSELERKSEDFSDPYTFVPSELAPSYRRKEDVTVALSEGDVVNLDDIFENHAKRSVRITAQGEQEPLLSILHDTFGVHRERYHLHIDVQGATVEGFPVLNKEGVTKNPEYDTRGNKSFWQWRIGSTGNPEMFLDNTEIIGEHDQFIFVPTQDQKSGAYYCISKPHLGELKKFFDKPTITIASGDAGIVIDLENREIIYE